LRDRSTPGKYRLPRLYLSLPTRTMGDLVQSLSAGSSNDLSMSEIWSI